MNTKTYVITGATSGIGKALLKKIAKNNIIFAGYRNIEYEKDNTGLSINTNSRLKLNDKNNQNIINSYDIDNFKINVSIPFNVTDNNADSIKDNTYTWELNKDDTYKEINVRYDYRNDRTSSIVILIIIGVISLGIILYLVNYLIRNRRI